MWHEREASVLWRGYSSFGRHLGLGPSNAHDGWQTSSVYFYPPRYLNLERRWWPTISGHSKNCRAVLEYSHRERYPINLKFPNDLSPNASPSFSAVYAGDCETKSPSGGRRME